MFVYIKFTTIHTFYAIYNTMNAKYEYKHYTYTR